MSAKKIGEIKLVENKENSGVVNWMKKYKWIIIIVVILLLIVVWWYFTKYKKKTVVMTQPAQIVDTRMPYPPMTDNLNVNVDRE